MRYYSSATKDSMLYVSTKTCYKECKKKKLLDKGSLKKFKRKPRLKKPNVYRRLDYHIEFIYLIT